MTDNFIEATLLMFIAVDPIMLVPIFANLTKGLTPKESKSIYIKATATAFLTLTIFWFFGTSLFDYFGIRMSSFKIVGGLFLIITAYKMLFDERRKSKEKTAEKSLDDNSINNIAIFPLAIPLIAGPAALATAVLIGAEKGETLESYLISFVPLLICCLLALIAMALTSRISKFFGPTILTVTEKILGLLLGALAIEFIIQGIETSFNLV
jgi:multiple antibiotic resistance protein